MRRSTAGGATDRHFKPSIPSLSTAINTYGEFEVLREQVLQLGDAFIYSVTSFLLYQAMRQLVRVLLEKKETFKIQTEKLSQLFSKASSARLVQKTETGLCRIRVASLKQQINEQGMNRAVDHTLLSSPRLAPLRGLYTYMGKSML